MSASYPSPGLVDTEGLRGLDMARRDAPDHETPPVRLGLPEEVADGELAVASHLRFTTGAVIPVDGGRPLG